VAETGSPTIVQSKGGDGDGSTSGSLAFSSGTTSGNTIVALFGFASGNTYGMSSAACSDSKDNTFTIQKSSTSGGTGAIVATAPITSAGTDTVSCSFSSSDYGGVVMEIYEVTDVSLLNPQIVSEDRVSPYEVNLTQPMVFSILSGDARGDDFSVTGGLTIDENGYADGAGAAGHGTNGNWSISYSMYPNYEEFIAIGISSLSSSTIDSAEEGLSNYLAGLTGNCDFGSSYCAPAETYDLPFALYFPTPSAVQAQIGYYPIGNNNGCDGQGIGGGYYANYIDSTSDGEYSTNETLVFNYNYIADGDPACLEPAVTMNVEAFWDYSATQIEVCAKVTNNYGAPTNFDIYLDSDEIQSSPSTNTNYCQVTNTFSDGIPNGYFDSFRYEYRSGTQQAYYMYLTGASSHNGFGEGGNPFATFLDAQSSYLTTGEDIYAPLWYWTIPSDDTSTITSMAANFDSQTYAYPDCSISSNNAQYWNTLEAMYQSKVCVVGVSNYITASFDGTLIPELVAIQDVADHNGDYSLDFNMCGNDAGGGTCYTPNQVLNYILDNYEVTDNGNVIGIETCVDLGSYGGSVVSLSCDYSSIAQGVATIATAELATVLAYGVGETNYTTIANTLVQDVLNARQTAATFQTNNGYTYYRPLGEGSIFSGWDGYNYASPSGFTSFSDMFGMTPEYGGYGSTSQEVNFVGLALLCTYNYLANGISDSCGNS
jgi:hypothetical protein